MIFFEFFKTMNCNIDPILTIFGSFSVEKEKLGIAFKNCSKQIFKKF